MRYFATRYSASSKVWELRKERVDGGDWTIFGWSGTNKTSWVRRHGMTCRARERERKARKTRKGHQRHRETWEIGLCLDICCFSTPHSLITKAWICAMQLLST